MGRGMIRLLGTLSLGLALAQAPCEGTRVVHDFGELCLKAPPSRIVALDWRPLEDLLLLGVTPVGAADLADFPRWVKLTVPPGIADVGERLPPNLERIALLQPDLILGYSGFQGKHFAELSRIAPTVLLDYLPSTGQLAAMRRHFLLHARIVGMEERGARLLSELDRFLVQSREALRAKGLAGSPFFLLQAWSRERVYNLFTRNTLASELLEQLGLRNAWEGKAQAYGLSRIGPEGLVRLVRDNPGVRVFLIAQPDNNPFADRAVGPLLRLSQARIHLLDPATWTYGGPHSARVLVEEVLQAMNMRR